MESVENHGDTFDFKLTEADLSDYQDTFNDLNTLANQQFGEFEPFDGNLEHNNPYQIRTGVIQDPRFEVLQNRVDNSGNPVQQKYSMLEPHKEQYPLNGINAVDVYGMRVAIKWLDGDDVGVYNDADSENTFKTPVQKLFLTFPQAWADMDRNCGDFSLPVVGTIVRVGMIRNNMGVYLGSIPSDKAKLPVLRLGDFLRKHYNQNTQYITDSSTLEAYIHVLKQDIYTQDPVIEPRPDSIDKPKPLETDEGKLSDLYKYDAHRHVMAQDGVSTSVKESCGKHDNICAKRMWDYQTNLSFDEAFTTLRQISQPTSGKIASPDGLFEWSSKPDGVNPPTLRDASIQVNTCKMNMEDVYHVIVNHFVEEEVQDVTISATDMVVTWTDDTVKVQTDQSLDYVLEELKKIKNFSVFHIQCGDGLFMVDSDEMEKASFNVTTNNLTLEDLADVLDEHFELDETVGIVALTNDATAVWTRRRGTVDSSITEAEDLKDAIFKIMGRPGKYYTITGSNRVLSGSCPLPEPSDHEDTCSRPND